MGTKRYKLTSANGENGAPGPCAFFASPAGCKNGSACKFLHGKPGDAAGPSPINEVGSVVSSESEVVEMEEVAVPTAATTSTPKQKKKTKTKRKSNSGGDSDIFLKPKSHGESELPPATMPPSHKKQKVTTGAPAVTSPIAIAVAPAKKSAPASTNRAQRQPPQKNAKQPAADFRNLMLPIAAFSIPDVSPQQPTQENAPTEEEKTPAPVAPAIKREPLPLPTHTPTGRKWQNAIIKTRQHVRYNGSYDFEKMKEADEEAGRGYASDWITARKFGLWCANNPQAIAIDCEMCETRDPVTGSVDSKALCRVSIVNAENPDEVLLDTLVRPTWPIVDFRSRIHGIKEEDLANVQFTLRHAQAFLIALCSDETVIIGQALHNDFAALRMEHHCSVDSSYLFEVKDSPSATPSLKAIAKSVIKKEMPEVHDSVNDARTALLCLEAYLSQDGKVDPVERTVSRYTEVAVKLFVHRIPKKCKVDHLTSMFLDHASVKPSQVDEIDFSGDTGKTHVTFPSIGHANLAFDALAGKPEPDKSGRLQKKVYLVGGGYVRVRKMIYPKSQKQNSTDEG